MLKLSLQTDSFNENLIIHKHIEKGYKNISYLVYQFLTTLSCNSFFYNKNTSTVKVQIVWNQFQKALFLLLLKKKSRH